MKRTMSPEMDAWVAHQHAQENQRARAQEQRIDDASLPLTTTDFEWLWPRFQKCKFGMISAATRFAKTPLCNVTVKGKRFAIRMAFRHRTQIFGTAARKMSHDEFLGAIRSASATVSNA
jgi:hypothetical protein